MKKRTITLSEVKGFVNKLQGKEVKLKIHTGRNRFKTLLGEIEGVYPSVFTVKTEKERKSFSYFAIACSDVVITKI